MRYDDFQKKAIDYINKEYSVIVSAPTGAGKTVIAEQVINNCLKNGTRVVYTAPIKALSNQKYRDFSRLYPDSTGIITGDVSINPHAQLLIMTTEIFRNKTLSEENELADYSWIIFDEIHYIDDYERGTVWEESLIFLPDHMNILALSATIPNIEDFSGWIQSIHKKTLKIVIENNRSVPLHLFFQCENKFYDQIDKMKNFAHLAKKNKYHYHHGKKFKNKLKVRPNRIDTLIRHLETTDKLPCIYFSFSRKRCEYLAENLHGFDFLDTHEKAEVLSLFHSLCERFNLQEEKSAKEMFHYIARGIAFHHAGMLPTLKEVVERLFTAKLIKVIFTTETFALGINMPARTVIFDELRKFYGSFFANLKTRDFYQMAGRAGRRGIDAEGFVYSRINFNYMDFNELKRVVESAPEKVKSRFNASYATIINLYRRLGEKLYDIYPLSLHYHQEKNRSRDKAVQQMEAKLLVLEDLGCISDGVLTEKGDFASKLYGYELPLSELHDRGIIENLHPEELGILAISSVFEPRKNSSMPPLSKQTKRLRNLTDESTKHIHRIEKRNDMRDLSKKHHYHLSPCIEAWMNQCKFSDLFKYTDVDEGEIIRYFRMGVQILRELLDTPASVKLKEKIRKAIYLINRDIIDAETQLRETDA